MRAKWTVLSSVSSLVLATSLIISTPATAWQKKDAKKANPEGTRTQYYKKWLQEDVVYIITDDEKKVFKDLTTEDEKEKFIEQFWYRRDPDPRTTENEFKEEHYRRIAYANERFASGIPGWKTDRGRTYITFGHRRRSNPIPQEGATIEKSMRVAEQPLLFLLKDGATVILTGSGMISRSSSWTNP